MKARGFDPAVLFEALRSKHALKDHPFPTLRAELDAVRSNRKPISRLPALLEDLAGGATETLLVPLLRAGLAMTLSSTHSRGGPPPSEHWPITIHACRVEELWRVSALIAFSDQPLNLGWPDGIEAHQSTLLGYPRAQRKRWLEHLRWAYNFYAYTLLPREQVLHVRRLGRRCFGSVDQVTGMTFFMHRFGPLRRDAHTLVPRALTLARTQLDAKLLRVLLGDWTKRPPKIRKGLNEVSLTRQQARAFTAHMFASVELLTHSGWQ